jgi:hypothetical protein
MIQFRYKSSYYFRMIYNAWTIPEGQHVDAEAMFVAGDDFTAEYKKVGRETVERKAGTESSHTDSPENHIR